MRVLIILSLSAFLLTADDGKKWIVRQTPFGVSRVEAGTAPPEPSKTPDPYPGITATEIGDSIRFQRPSPFGLMQWTVKKSELSDMERAVWDREKAKAAPKGRQ